MTEEGFKRKLAAILSADVKGYSRMMRDDEDATIRTLTNYRSAISNLIQKFRGHVVDATGDNLLAKFTSVVDAVNCAVEIQRELAERNAELSECVNQPRCSHQAASKLSVRLSQKSSHQSSALKMRKANIGSIESACQLAPGIFNLFCGIDLCALSISPDPIG